MDKKPFTSPIGEVRWAVINGKGKEDLNGNLKYSLEIHVPAEAAEAALTEIDNFWNANKPKGVKVSKSLGYKTTDEDTVVFTAKTNTTFPDGTAKKVICYDSKAQEFTLPDDVRVSNGSVGRFSATMAIYSAGKAGGAGVTFYLNSVQFKELIEYKGGNPFDDVGDAFTSQEFAPMELDS